jgi:thiamine-monophosphate kinase
VRSEFDFIDQIRSRYALGRIGDDCAVLPKDAETDMLVTADLLVEDIDFRLDWTTPEFLGHRSLAVSLSDVAAMGAAPTHALLSLGVPEALWKTDFLNRFYGGWHELARKHAVELVGGDISRSPDKLFIDSIVFGEVARGKAVLRSGANAGDLIFVTGFLGGAAAGLELLRTGTVLGPEISVTGRHLLLKQLQPIPQVQTGKLLTEYNLATSLIDLSDGLSSDLSHVAAASGVGATINADVVPIDPAIFDISSLHTQELDLALNGGEDYELLLTVAPHNAHIALDLGFHHIGEITDSAGKLELLHDGISESFFPKGFRHF